MSLFRKEKRDITSDKIEKLERTVEILENLVIVNKKQNLEFLERYFKFHDYINFTIRRGIKTEIFNGSCMLHSCMLHTWFNCRGLNYAHEIFTPATIREIQHLKFSDIINFKRWHLSGKKDSEGNEYDPLTVMRDIYGDNFDENEIVTLIWFKVLE